MREKNCDPEKWELVNKESKALLKEFMLNAAPGGAEQGNAINLYADVPLFLVYVLESLRTTGASRSCERKDFPQL